ncbi:MAG: alanine racemase [Defluviitaleaceae bacterium]|nr:alanine racemase [Defluviitaleaceae bacterium]
MENNFARAAAIVDLAQIKANIRIVQGLVGSAKIMAVIKANAYGHGVSPNAPIAHTAVMAGCEWLSVATPNEGVILRQSGITTPILVMGAIFESEFEVALSHDLTVTIFDIITARNLSDMAQNMGKTANVHIKIDTGMNRLGFKEFDSIEEIAALPNLCIDGIYSHFAASESDPNFTKEQFAGFAAVAKGLEIPNKHIANSGAVLHHPEYNLNMVRIGVLIYGLAPCSTPKGAEKLRKMGIMPAMTLKSRIGHIKTIAKGESVGYGRSFVADGDMQIATIPLGYGDGISRQLSNRGFVLIGGKHCPVVGTVCMDQLMVDATSTDAKAGDEVIFIGTQSNARITAEDIAGWQGSINYEVTTAISQRVQRFYT